MLQKQWMRYLKRFLIKEEKVQLIGFGTYKMSPIAASRNVLIGASIVMVPAALILDQPWKIHITALSLFSLFTLGSLVVLCYVRYAYVRKGLNLLH